MRMTQNKNDSINSILQHGLVKTKIVVQYLLLQDIHIWSCLPDSANGR